MMVVLNPNGASNGACAVPEFADLWQHALTGESRLFAACYMREQL
jgi:hypothetical protein